jgi:hypothetical protein
MSREAEDAAIQATRGRRVRPPLLPRPTTTRSGHATRDALVILGLVCLTQTQKEARMACYLCAYLRTDRPERLDFLDPSSPARAGEEVGTCWMCKVAACPIHGTRYAQFECAICTPAAATIDALGAPARGDSAAPSGDLGSAAAIAARIGARAAPEQLERVERALVNIESDRAAADYPPPVRSEWQDSPANLVHNYRGVAARWLGEGDFVERADGVSLDAVSAVIRETFAGRGEARQPPNDRLEIVTGALQLAVAVADPQAEERDNPDVRLPWEMAHPILLDPLMWMVATAYRLDS